MRRWYAVHTHAHGELKAFANLARQGFRAYLPRYLRRRSHARRVEIVPSPLFPRYLFAEFDKDREAWRPILSTFGVQSIVCYGLSPLAVPEDVIEQLMAAEDPTGHIPLRRMRTFDRGDRVMVEYGPFAGKIGLFDCQSDDERVVILLDLLGRQVRVQVESETLVAYS